MTDAPERIWTCKHIGEYGRYYPEAVEAEGEHGGEAVEYVRADARPMTVAEAATRAKLELAYLAGFKASGEGWNGEYPFQDNNASPTTDAHWIAARDAALRALSEGGE